jgi:hypothetical protein
MLRVPALQTARPNRVPNKAPPTANNSCFKGFVIALNGVRKSVLSFLSTSKPPRTKGEAIRQCREELHRAHRAGEQYEGRPLSWSYSVRSKKGLGSRLCGWTPRKVARLVRICRGTPAMTAAEKAQYDNFKSIAKRVINEASIPKPLRTALSAAYEVHFLVKFNAQRSKYLKGKKRWVMGIALPDVHTQALELAVKEVLIPLRINPKNIDESPRQFRIGMTTKQVSDIQRNLNTGFKKARRYRPIHRTDQRNQPNESHQRIVECTEKLPQHASVDCWPTQRAPTPPAPPACTDLHTRCQNAPAPAETNVPTEGAINTYPAPNKLNTDSDIVNVPATLGEEFWSMLLKEPALQGRLPKTRLLHAIKEQERHHSNVEQLERQIQTLRFRWNGPDVEEKARRIVRRHSMSF